MKKQMIVLAAMIAASFAAVAAPSEAYKCYKPDSGQSIYPWDNGAKWFPSVNNSSSCGVPTSADHVFLYSSKNNVASSGKPMVVTNGVAAETGILEICDKDNGAGSVIGITVKNGGTMTNYGQALIGNSRNGKNGGGLLSVESGGTWTAKDNFLLGVSSGTSWLNVESGGSFVCEKTLAVGQAYGWGVVTNSGTMTVANLYLGAGLGLSDVKGNGLFVNKGALSVSGSLNVANDLNSSGRFILEDGATVSNVASVAIGTPDVVSQASLEFRGGSLWIKGRESGQSIGLGKDGNGTNGRILGWGNIFNLESRLRIKLYGQVVADGDGVERDLNLAAIRTVGTGSSDELNACGTNGWYAVNKGRLVYPRAQPCDANSTSHPTIGDYPNRTEPTAMNSLRYALDTPPTKDYCNYAELYAPDRTDIPSGLPGDENSVVAGVWRLGLSSTSSWTADPTPIAFGGMTVSFRYDWQGIPAKYKIAVYHHDGSPSGSWRRISEKQEVSQSDNLITTTSPINSSSETWNAGWFAVVAQNPNGLVIIFR